MGTDQRSQGEEPGTRVDFTDYARYRKTLNTALRQILSGKAWHASFASWLANAAAEVPNRKTMEDLLALALVLLSLILSGLTTYWSFQNTETSCAGAIAIFPILTWAFFEFFSVSIFLVSTFRHRYVRYLALTIFLVWVVGTIPFFWDIRHNLSIGIVFELLLFGVSLALIIAPLLFFLPKLTPKKLLSITIITLLALGVVWLLVLVNASSVSGREVFDILRETSVDMTVIQSYWLFWLFFPFAWLLYSVLPAVPRVLKHSLVRLLDAWHAGALAIYRLGQLLEKQLQVNPVYPYSLVGLALYALSVLIIEVMNEPSPVCGNYPIALGVSVWLGLGWVTFSYLAIPEELARIRIRLPSLFSRRILQTVVVLGLLVFAWCILYSFLFINCNAMFTHSFEYTPGGKAEPDMIDYMFYSFALITNAGYGDVHPTGLFAKVLVMSETLVGIILLVIFIQAALATGDNPEDSRSIATSARDKVDD